MSKAAITWWSVFILLCVILFTKHEDTLPSIGLIWALWIIMGIAYGISAQSNAPLKSKFTKLIVVACVFAGYAYIREGQPSSDEDGNYEGGYQADHTDKSAAAVDFFMRIIVAGGVGVYLSDALRKNEK